MMNNAVKLDLLRSNVAAKLKAQDAKKRNNDLAFLMGGADMLQSSDEKLKAWFLAECGLILNQISEPPTPTPQPSPSDDASAASSSTEAADQSRSRADSS